MRCRPEVVVLIPTKDSHGRVRQVARLAARGHLRTVAWCGQGSLRYLLNYDELFEQRATYRVGLVNLARACVPMWDDLAIGVGVRGLGES
jgi:hypothetical protein